MPAPIKAPIRDRHAILLELLANKPDTSVRQAMLMAGFSQNSADKQAKRALTTALKRQTLLGIEGAEKYSNLYERVGIGREDVLKQYVHVIEQNRDYSSKLKAMAPLLKQEGIDLTPGAETQQAPIISIVSVRNDTPIQAEYRTVEPLD